MLKNINLAARFVLELVALGAVAYWGTENAGTQSLRLGLGVGLPLLSALLWGMFVSPRARSAVHEKRVSRWG
jgi:uncharacterized protein DUF2568